jgi:hypothetical protein
MNKVDLAADKFTEDAGSRMTEFTINPAKGTAEMRNVSDGLAQFELGLVFKMVCRHTECTQQASGKGRPKY